MNLRATGVEPLPSRIVLYAVGSPVVVDFEETLARSGVPVAAAVQNVAGDIFLQDRSRLIALSAVSEALKADPFVVPLFTPGHRQQAAMEAFRSGFRRAATIVDATSIVPTAWSLGSGCYVNAGCVIGGACEFAEFVFVNRGACIGHHVMLGRFVSIGPGVVLGGMTRIAHGAMVGAGSVVLPQVQIGANAVVGAGAVVTSDVPDHCLAVGNPAKVVRTGIVGHAGCAVT